MHFLDAEETAERLSYPDLISSLKQMLRKKAAGKVRLPPRIFLELDGQNSLVVMPAGDNQLTIDKTVTIHPRNPERGLARIQGEVLVIDSRTGRRLGILEGGVVTARRTAAVSALAAQLLTNLPSGDLLIIGAGRQGRAHLEAFVEVFDVDRVFIYSRSLESAARLAALAEEMGVVSGIVEAPEEVAREMTFIVTATSSPVPVLSCRLSRATFVAAVGAYRLDMAEVSRDVVSEAALFVDTLEGARREAGDLIQAGIDWSTVTELAELIKGPRKLVAGRPILFKSVGSALWDLAAAHCVFPDGSF